VKFHSHPSGSDAFSALDDKADRELFSAVDTWIERSRPHASTVLLPDGRMFGRSIDREGAFVPLACIAVAGDDLHYWYSNRRESVVGVAAPAFVAKNAQLFGSATTERLRHMTVAVVGCSGTGCVVIEQLMRLGVGCLILVDPDVIENKNLNRIINAKTRHANQKIAKVAMFAETIEETDLGTKVIAIARNLIDPDVVRTVAQADFVFGCMDTAEGRHLLNRLSCFYLLPYLDIGVKLEADGCGGVDQVCASTHYLQPGGSSLLSRGVYTMEDVQSEAMKRTNPEQYVEQVRSRYINGVVEERPAVISINMQIAAIAVNDFLARLHPYRNDPNGKFAVQRVSLTDAYLQYENDGQPCAMLAKHVGRGDVTPLLDRPDLTEPGTLA
jgi:hypothetical protein